MRRNSQGRPVLSSRVQSHNGKPAKLISPRKIVLGMTLLIAISSLLVIIRIVDSNQSKSNSINKLEQHPPPSTFPLLSKAVDSRPPQPTTKTLAGDNKLSQDRKSQIMKLKQFEEQWDKWANPPLFGSFQYSSTSSIHFPHSDLQTYYHNHKPDFGNLKGGYPSPAVMAHIKSPDSDFALLTRKGNKFLASGVRANQDRAVILSPFHQEGDWWMGLFDGHGDMGHVISHAAALEFPHLLLERIPPSSGGSSSTNSDNVKAQAIVLETLKQTFVDVHQSLPNLIGAGSTGISILKLGQLLYISNLGDSEAFVASYDARGTDLEIIYTTTPHKPDTPGERARIEAAGGRVLPAPPYPGASARVIIPMLDDSSMQGMEIALAMSRSLGDKEADGIGVIAEPTTDVLDITEILQKEAEQQQQKQNHDASTKRYYMVVVASDGLFDRVPPMEVAQHVAKSLLPIHPLSPLPALEQLILKSSDLWLRDSLGGGGEYRDDISIAVHKLAI